MSYVCGACLRSTAPGESRRLYVIQRRVPHPRHPEGFSLVHKSGCPTEAKGVATRTEISQEVPVCRGCDDELTLGGKTFREVVLARRVSPYHGTPRVRETQPILSNGYRVPPAKPVVVRLPDGHNAPTVVGKRNSRKRRKARRPQEGSGSQA